jgi:phage minor structural protein
MTVSNPASLRSLLGGTDNTLSYIYGGEYHYDSYTITLMSSRGSKKGVCFRYGKNITDFEQTIDCEDLYSSIFGFWRKPATDNTDEVLIYGNIIDVENVLPYDKIYVLDTSSLIKLKDENNNDIPPTSSQIDDYVRNYIASRAIGLPNYSMKLTYADDSSIIQVCLGDTVGVIFSDYNIKTIARCSRVVYDSLLERNESVDIGVVNNGIAGELASSFAKNNE